MGPEGDNGDDVGVTMPCVGKTECDAAVVKAGSGGFNRFTVDPDSCGALGESVFKWKTTRNGIDCVTAPNPGGVCTAIGIFPAFGQGYPEGVCLGVGAR